MSLTSCLTKANGFIDPAIERTLLERAESLEDRGQAPLGASRQAVQEAIDLLTRQLRVATSRTQEVKQSAARIDKFQGMTLRRASADIRVSAASAFADEPFTILPGVREVQLADVELQTSAFLESQPEQDRIKALAAQIARNQSIEPLFVARRADGSQYVAEGQHRAYALKSLGFASLPARIMQEGAGIKQSAPRSTWYSGLQRAVEAVPERLATMAAPQWRLWLDANAAKLGIKKDEIEWSGVKDYLTTMGKDKITKADISAYLSANGVKIEETVLGGDSEVEAWWNDEGGANEETPFEDLTAGEKAEARDRYQDETGQYAEDATKYGAYTVPGGQNYRELLLTLPPKSANASDEEIAAWYEQAYGTTIEDDAGPDWRSRRGEFIADMTSAQREDGDRVGFGDYTSNHWKQKNVLAHIRVDDRTDADGKRVLFINEIQSDWGADGRKKGFVGDMIPQDTAWTAVDTLDYADTRAEAEAKMAGLQEYLAQNREPGMENRLAIREANGGFEVVEEARSEAASAPRKSGVPRAPFITDTKAYVALALKRAIKLAVDEGYDKVALVTGEQASDFFSLAKQINSATWEKNYADGRLITLKDKNGEDIGISVDAEGAVYDSSIDGAEGKALDDVIGKDLASKIMDEPSGSLRGLELNVGGTGMKTYYNDLVPNVLRDVLKKLGGGKMETVTIQTDKQGWSITPPSQTVSGRWMLKSSDYNSKGLQFDTEAEAQAAMAERQEKSVQPAFTITPAMKEKAAGGMAMFSAKRAPPVDSPAFKAWFGKSLVTNEDGTPQVMYHGSNRDFKAFNRLKTTEFRAPSMDTVGNWFSSSPSDDGGAGMYTSGEGAAIYPVYLAISRPKVYDTFTDFLREMHESEGRKLEDQGPKGRGSTEGLRAKLKDQGYDGIAFSKTNTGELQSEADEYRAAIQVAKDEMWAAPKSERPFYAAKVKRMEESLRQLKAEIDATNGSTEFDKQYVWVTFEPEQIKSSIGNNGEFDGAQKDITQSVRRTGQEIRRLFEIAGDTAFRYGKSSGNEAAPAHPDAGIGALLARHRAATGADMAAIAKEVGAPKLAIRRDDKVDPRVDKLWVLTMDVDGAPRDAYISQKNNALWVNVAGLESGSGGDAVYQVAGAYAHNHQLKFIGDPDGITEAGKRRRLEAISALSLKYGTTEFIEPHKDMIGWNGLQWVGTDDDKIGLVAKASYTLVNRLYPEIKNVGFSNNEFTYRGEPIGRIALDRLVQQWRGALAGPQREGAPGSGTVRMAALYASLDARPDEGGGSGLRLGAGAADAAALRASLKNIRASAARDPQVDTPAFKAWFGDSKVVSASGRPFIVYHGTNQAITEFDAKKSQHGFWFSEDESDAEDYGGSVIEAYLAIRDPLYFTRTHGDRGVNEAIAKAKKDGRDGVIVTSPEDGDEDGMFWPTNYVAFSSSQIKSATGNNGQFDSASKDITQSTGRTATGASWESPSASKFDDMVYKLQDKQIETKRVVEAIKTASGGIADDLNVYLNEEMFHGRAAKRTEDFVNLELNPMIEEMAANGLTIADIEEFLHARHAQEANAVIAQRNPNEPGLQDGGSGMTNAEAANYLASLTPADQAKLQAAADKVDQIIRETRKMYVDYDLESQETVDAWDSMFQHYIPLQREDKTASPGIGQGFSIKGKETKGRTGSTRKVVDILANVAMQRERAIVRGEKNRVAKSLVGLAQANDNADFWTVDEVPTERVYNPATGLVEERADPMYKNRDNAVVAKIRDANGIVREHAVVFNEDDPRALRMATALKNLDATQLEGLLGVSAKITRYFASINTSLNPIFGVVNLVRDVQGAMLNLTNTPLANDKAKIARYTASALAGIYSDLRAARRGQSQTSAWATLWAEFQEVGGQTGYRDMFATSADRGDAIQRALDPTSWMNSPLGKVFTANGTLKVPLAAAQKQAGALFDWLNDYNDAMENGVRLSAYKAGLERGLSKQQAASVAKNLTTNFNRKGQVSQQAGAMYAFFNAAIQGTARIGQTLFDMEPGKPKTLRLSKTGKKIVYGGILLGSVQAMALAAAGFGDEDPPEFARERNLIIPTGGKTYVSIPMPLGMHIIPNIGRVATEFALSGFKDPIKRSIGLTAMFADAFNPIGNAGLSMQTLAPTVLDPLVALTENKDWTGRPISKTSFNKATPGHALGRDTSTAVAEFLSEAINTLSGGNEHVAGVFSPTPDSIDYLGGQLTGGLGREYSKVEQTLKSTWRGETLPTYKIPLVGRFVGNAKGQASEGSAFYANVDQLNEIETEAKGLKEAGKEKEARALLASKPEAYLITQANYAENQARKLRKQKSELIKAGAPREQVVAIEAKITEVMARLNRAMEKLEASKD